MANTGFTTLDEIYDDAPKGWFREMPEGLMAVSAWLDELANTRTSWSH